MILYRKILIFGVIVLLKIQLSHQDALSNAFSDTAVQGYKNSTSARISFIVFLMETVKKLKSTFHPMDFLPSIRNEVAYFEIPVDINGFSSTPAEEHRGKTGILQGLLSKNLIKKIVALIRLAVIGIIVKAVVKITLKILYFLLATKLLVLSSVVVLVYAGNLWFNFIKWKSVKKAMYHYYKVPHEHSYEHEFYHEPVISHGHHPPHISHGSVIHDHPHRRTVLQIPSYGSSIGNFYGKNTSPVLSVPPTYGYSDYYKSKISDIFH